MQRLGWGIVSASGLVIALVGGCATNNSDGLIGGAGGTGVTVSSTKSTSAGPTTSAGTTTSVTSVTSATSTTSATSVTSTVAATSSVSTTNSVQSSTAISSTSSGMVPAGWTCNSTYYNDGDCDCGCGVQDPDCATALVADCVYCSDTGSCSSVGCPGAIDPTDNSKCVAPTLENTAAACADMLDNDQDGSVDCSDSDCAAMPGCAENTDAACSDMLDNDGDFAIDCEDTDCQGHPGCAPVAWTCDPTYYNSGFTMDCDCGCGVVDPDCADALATTCDYCTSGCSMSACPGTINATNNAICP